MARSRYEYETSPRKLEPEIRRKKQTQRNKLTVVEDLPRQNVKVSKKQKERQKKLTLIVMGIFILLLTISYRNSQINERFSQVQTLKRQLSSLQKENEQLKVNIENSVNLNTIENLAKNKLGMQKLTNNQLLMLYKYIIIYSHPPSLNILSIQILYYYLTLSPYNSTFILCLYIFEEKKNNKITYFIIIIPQTNKQNILVYQKKTM